jgi:anti-anti-sigma factor
VLAIRLEGALFFVTADSLEDRVSELVDGADDPISLVVLDCQSINFIDAQGADKLERIANDLEGRGIEFALARVKPPVLAVLERSGTLEQVGRDHLHLDVGDAVDAYLSSGAGLAPVSRPLSSN